MPASRDPRILIDLLDYSNVPGLHRKVYVAISPPNSLTLAQAVHLGLIVAGYDESQIAAIVGVGLQTVKNRIKALRDALGAKDLSHLAVRALETRVVIIDPPDEEP